ncbi:hypothetical protein [Streptomyces sp. SID13726]|uniref:hypothetical protein n=1 Tax=Streptomyces sp. SID13726 TaxID=2706058 RepID=UPI0013B81793|nr:hypothetical protein [Streptomyces sp. SID13726]NEB04519.1 hypothetical protein [Streptomyces sp. SID13726]
MNAMVWRNTRSNELNFHAFAEGVALCNRRITPNEGGFVTAAQAKAQPMSHLCERCEKKVAAVEAQAEREAYKPQALTPAEAGEVADAQGRVLFEGNANTHKRPQGFPEVITIEDQGKGMFALKDEQGDVIKRVRSTTRLWVRRCPANIDEIRAEAHAQAEAVAESFELTEVHLTPQDIADAELGACEWTPEQIEDAARAAAGVVGAAEALTKEAAESGMRVVPAEARQLREALDGILSDVGGAGLDDSREAAAARYDALRNPVEVEAENTFPGFNRNQTYHQTMAQNEKQRASWKRVATASMFAHYIKDHAQANAANGWDVILEGWSDGELNVMMLECVPQSREEAIAYARTKYVDPHREREAQALAAAWGF